MSRFQHTCVSLLWIVVTAVSEPRNERFTVLTTVMGKYNTYTVTGINTRFECAVQCENLTSCLFAQFFPNNAECQLFTTNNNFAFVYPYDNSVAQSSVLKTQRSMSRVVHVRSELGINQFLSSEGSSICAVLGGVFATYNHLLTGYNDGYMNHGSCVHTASGVYYVLQQTISGIGYQGVNSCSPQTHADVFCYIQQ